MMKKIVTLLLIFIASYSYSQTISFTFNPLKMGPGLIYSQDVISDTLSILASIEDGVYRVSDEYLSLVKYGLGFGYEFKQNRKATLLLFITYYQIYEDNTYDLIDPNDLNMISFEIGISSHINKGISGLIILDPLNWEAKVGLSVNIKQQIKNYENKTK